MNGNENMPVLTGESALNWQGFRSFQLVSLYMIRFYADKFVRITVLIGELRAAAAYTAQLNPSDTLRPQEVESLLWGEFMYRDR